MQMSGEQRIAAPRQRVWDALNDPAVLRACIPGCQSLEKVGEDHFDAVAEVRIGPIGARFKGAVQLTEQSPPNGYRIVGEGSGGIAGNAKGGARVRLSDDGAGTLIAYDVDAQVGGRLAQLGGPLIDATAKQLAGKFFAKFAEVVGAPAVQPEAAAPAAAHLGPPVAGAADPVPQFTAPAVAPVAAPGEFPWAWAVAVVVAIVGGFLLGRSDAGEAWVVAMIVLALVAAGAGYEAGRRR
jgi:uncharacterized protein